MNRPGPRPWPTPPLARARREVDPIVLQIVEGTLNSIEREIERTAHVSFPGYRPQRAA